MKPDRFGTTVTSGSVRVRQATVVRALLLIDFQRDFLDPAGRMPVDLAQVGPVIAAANAAIRHARAEGALVVAIGNEFLPNDWLMNLLRRRAAIAGSEGVVWDGRVEAGDATYLPKTAADAFKNPDLAALLTRNDVGRLTIAGLYARACVAATAVSGLRRGYAVEILTDAVACASEGSRRRSLGRLERRGALLTAST